MCGIFYRLPILGGCLCFGPLVERAVFHWGFSPLASTDFFFFLWLTSDSCTQLGKYEAKGKLREVTPVLFFGIPRSQPVCLLSTFQSS